MGLGACLGRGLGVGERERGARVGAVGGSLEALSIVALARPHTGL